VIDVRHGLRAAVISWLPMDAAEDAVLARRIASGDPTAEATLCRRLLPRVRAWGFKHVRDEALALDLGQQVVLSVLEALRSGRVVELDRLGAFVIGTCRNTLFAWRRGERRRSDLLERYGPALAEVAELRHGALDQDRLAHCFEALAPRARAVLALTYYAERSADEIGDELGLSAGNVRVARHRALEQLHGCMEGA
jgi:RNA polymerase sigma-70 factor (ECF subfamily)